MKIVLDTNVVIAALIAHGQCNELLEHCAIRHTLISSKSLLDELQDVLVRKFKYTKTEARKSAQLIRSKAVVVKPRPLPSPVCRDPDDDMVLGTALAGDCACILTGDKDLTILDPHQNIRILAPGDFWAYELNKEC